MPHSLSQQIYHHLQNFLQTHLPTIHQSHRVIDSWPEIARCPPSKQNEDNLNILFKYVNSSIHHFSRTIPLQKKSTWTNRTVIQNSSCQFHHRYHGTYSQLGRRTHSITTLLQIHQMSFTFTHAANSLQPTYYPLIFHCQISSVRHQ